jgi:hypothetical protein
LVVPDLSERCTTVIGVLGSSTFGLLLLMAGSFQVVILPSKIFAIVGPSRFRCLPLPEMLLRLNTMAIGEM